MDNFNTLMDVPHPGEFIAEELEARGWLQRDLAYILGVSEQSVNTIIAGKRGISTEMAKALGDAFDVSPVFFSNLQNAYDMARARAPDPAIKRRAELQSAFPIREMMKRGWLANTDVSLVEGQLLRFFKRDSLEDIPFIAHAAKKTNYDNINPAQLAWLYRVKQIASEMVVSRYSEVKLRDAVESVFNRYMLDPEEVRNVPRVLSECGVKFVVVETLPKAQIDGVCFWENNYQPVIGITARFDRIDNFWFVLLHEIGHVLNLDGQTASDEDVCIDIDLKETSSNLSEIETRANLFAQNVCVPSEEISTFILRKAPFISERDVLGFSRRIGRHAGIVVGQLQYKLNRPEYLNKLKVKIRQHLLPSAVVDGWGEQAPVSL